MLDTNFQDIKYINNNKKDYSLDHIVTYIMSNPFGLNYLKQKNKNIEPYP